MNMQSYRDKYELRIGEEEEGGSKDPFSEGSKRYDSFKETKSLQESIKEGQKVILMLDMPNGESYEVKMDNKEDPEEVALKIAKRFCLK